MPFKKPVIGAQCVIQTGFAPQQWDTLHSVISAQTGIQLLDINVLFEQFQAVITLIGEPGSMLNALLTTANFMNEWIDSEHPLNLWCLLYSVSGIMEDELQAYQKILGTNLVTHLQANVFQVPERTWMQSVVDFKAIPSDWIQLKTPEAQSKSDADTSMPTALNVLLCQGKPHLFWHIGTNTDSLKSLETIIDELDQSLDTDAEGTYFVYPIWRDEKQAGELVIEFDYSQCYLYEIFISAQKSLLAHKMNWIGSEFVGVCNRDLLLNLAERIRFEQKSFRIASEKEDIDLAVQTLGLARYGQFDDNQLFENHYYRYIQSLRQSGLTEFGESLSRSHQAPGGGSAAAYTASMGASLILMVINSTLYSKKYESLHTQYYQYGLKIRVANRLLVESIDLDAEALTILLKNSKLFRSEDPELKEKKKSIVRQACLIPLEVIKICSALVELISQIVGDCNPSAITDLGVAARMIEAAAQSSYYNIIINLNFDTEGHEISLKEEADNLLTFIHKVFFDIEQVLFERISPS